MMIQSLTPNNFNVKFIQLAIVICLLLGLSVSALAQAQTSTNDGSTPAGIAPGAPAGSYTLSGFEHINQFNGRLSINLPLVKMGGRGSASYTAALSINARPWIINSYMYQPSYYYYTPYEYWLGMDPGYGPGVMQLRHSGDYVYQETSDQNYYYGYTLTTLTFSSSDGTEYELIDQQSGGGRQSGTGIPDGYNRGKVFVTRDGTAATFISDDDIYDRCDTNAVSVLPVSGKLYLKDGTRYRVQSGLVTEIRDRNGNKITFAYDTSNRITSATDSLNRQVTFAYSVNAGSPYGTCDTITYRGLGGGTRVVRISRTNLSNVLRSGSVQTYAQLFPQLNFAGGTSYNPNNFVSTVWLPDDRNFQFKYNTYGELNRLVLPTGGKFEYEFGAGSATGPSSGVIGYVTELGPMTTLPRNGIYRRVTERRIYPDGSTLEGKTVYNQPTVSSGNLTALVKNLDSTGTVELSVEKHYFTGDPEYSILNTFPSYLSDLSHGKEYQTDALGSSSTQELLQRVAHVWSYPSLPAGPRITSTTITLGDSNQVSKKTFSYDQYNNQTDVYEYDYGSGTYGSLVRSSHTDYLTTHPVSSAVYDNPYPVNTSLTMIHLRGLPTKTQVFDASSNKKSETVIEYDNYSTDSFHAGLTTRSSISGLDSSYTTSYTTRGNVTGTTSYTNAAALTGAISAYSQYDIAGNVVKTIDARSTTGNVIATTIDYSDRFGSADGDARNNTTPSNPNWLNGQSAFAFPTKVTNALSQEAYTQYDYYLGQPVDTEDSNGVKSSIYYSDGLDRPTKGIGAVGTSLANQTNIYYNDSARTITVISDKDTSGESGAGTPTGLKVITLYDGLGRTYRKATYEGSSTWSIVETQFDGMGRAYRSCNPFRASAADAALPSSPEWTTTSFDKLSRATSVQAPDGSVGTTDYYGNLVQVTDPTTKKRLSKTNALDQVTDVWEITAVDSQTENVTFNSTSLNGYHTSYTYSVLNDLLTTTQQAGSTTQTRTFVYDSMKRKTSATAPESGTTAYTYDNNGNLLTKTDARGVVTTVTYDSLNRPTSRTYTTSGTTALSTPTVNFYYDNQSLPSGAPTYTRGSSVGRLVAVTYGGGSEGNYYAYDSLGQVTQKWQRTGTTNYQIQASYNFAGAMTGETYPSGHTVSYTTDTLGRLASFSGNLGDGTSRTYSTGITYNAAGQMKREQFGTSTSLYRRVHYNNRLQPFDIRLGTDSSTTLDNDVLTDWQYATGSWDRGALRLYYATSSGSPVYGNGGTNNNGNLIRQDHFMPADISISNWAMNYQEYTYDSLNRLKTAAESSQTPSGVTPTLQQAFTYDRWGNRTIDQANTWAKDGTVWVEDSVPTGATASSDGGDSWNWVTSSPSAYSGTSSQQSNIYSGEHQHFFYGATATLSVSTNDKLYAYVYLDPSNPPSEVVLQWNNGDWEHRAYWGANNITVWGTDGTNSRRYMGPLPATGRWVRLEVSASSVGLEGSTLNGMAFSLYGGRAWFDRAGKTTTALGGANNKEYTVDATKNQLQAPSGYTAMQYDAAGNLKYDGYTNPDLGAFKYDAENKLREVYSYTSSLAAQYVYDGSGKRIKRIIGSNETWQVYGIGGELIAEYSSTATTTVQKEYGYRGGQLLITAKSDGKVKWIVQDHLGSPRMVIDKSGRLTDDTSTSGYDESLERHDYLPFGEELGAGVGSRTTAYGFIGDSNRQKFTGKERDSESGLDFFEARYMANVQGRFTSPDSFGGSIGNPQSLNLYAYVQNNPASLNDPTGHFPNDPKSLSPQEEEDLQRHRRRQEFKDLNRLNDTMRGWARIDGRDSHGRPISNFVWVPNPKVHDVPNNHVYIDTSGNVVQLHGDDKTNIHGFSYVRANGRNTDGRGNPPPTFRRWGDTIIALRCAGYEEFTFIDPHKHHWGGIDFGIRDASPALHITVKPALVGGEPPAVASLSDIPDNAPIYEVQVHIDRFSQVGFTSQMNHLTREFLAPRILRKIHYSPYNSYWP